MTYYYALRASTPILHTAFPGLIRSQERGLVIKTIGVLEQVAETAHETIHFQNASESPVVKVQIGQSSALKVSTVATLPST